MPSRPLLLGTLILLAASIFNKSVGFIYQILVMRLIKPEGVGLFSMIFPIYVMMLVVASMGIPIAISKLVAEEVAKNNLRGAYRIFKTSLLLITGSSLILSTVVFVNSSWLVKHISPNPDVYLCFVSLIPSVIIVSLCSAFRGFFQGLQTMTPTAVTQVAEQIVRVTTGLGIAWFLLPKGVHYAAVGISLGVLLGELTGFLVMVCIFIKKRPRISISSQRFSLKGTIMPLGRIFNIGVPVTLTRLVSTGLMSIDALIIPRSLILSGMTLSLATSAYGQFVGITQALIFTPGAITIALSTVMIPAISEAQALGKTSLLKSRIQDAIRITLLVGIPLVFVFTVIPHDLSHVLFGYYHAGDALVIMASCCPFLYLQQTTTGILQGLGRADVPLKSMLYASFLKVPGIFLLTSLPGFGIKGAAVALGISYIIMAILNYRVLKKITGVKIDNFLCIFKPLLASVVMALFILLVKKTILPLCLPGLIYLFLLLSSGASVYLIALNILGVIKFKDFAKILMVIKK